MSCPAFIFYLYNFSLFLTLTYFSFELNLLKYIRSYSYDFYLYSLKNVSYRFFKLFKQFSQYPLNLGFFYPHWQILLQKLEFFYKFAGFFFPIIFVFETGPASLRSALDFQIFSFISSIFFPQLIICSYFLMYFVVKCLPYYIKLFLYSLSFSSSILLTVLAKGSIFWL